MNTKKLEKVLNDQLEEYSFEEILEMFDLTTIEIFELAYDSGLLSDEILESMLSSDS